LLQTYHKEAMQATQQFNNPDSFSELQKNDMHL